MEERRLPTHRRQPRLPRRRRQKSSPPRLRQNHRQKRLEGRVRRHDPTPPPIATTIHGQRQIIFFTQEGLVALTADKGDVLWRYDFPFKVSTAASPVVDGDIVFCSAGYGVGGGAVKINKSGSKFTADEIWRKDNDVINHWSTPSRHRRPPLRHVLLQKIRHPARSPASTSKPANNSGQKTASAPAMSPAAGNKLIALLRLGERRHRRSVARGLPRTLPHRRPRRQMLVIPPYSPTAASTPAPPEQAVRLDLK